MNAIVNAVFAANNVAGKFGPKAAAVGVLLVLVGQVLQGHWDQLDGNSALEALIALGLWTSRPNKVSSESAGAK